MGLEVSLMGIHREEEGFISARIKRKTPVLRPAIQSNHISLCSFHSIRDRGRGEPNDQIVRVKKAADGRRSLIKRGKNGSLKNTSTDSKEITFVILINHASAPDRKERLSQTSKARRGASRNEFMERSGIPD